MRPIKFRIWDTKNKRWFHGGTDEESRRTQTDAINLFGEVIMFGEILRDQNTDETIRIERIEDLVALQYTGLKDKNGKEIYEGDIVFLKGDQHFPLSMQKDNSYQIIWDNGCFVVEKLGKIILESYTTLGYVISTIETEIAANGATDTYIEVIGNVYENPELLEEK